MALEGFDAHDHSACITGALDLAEQQCIERGLRFTPVRKRVLQFLLEDHRAMGAYEILERLREEGLGSQPPVAYRALDFLTKQGFAHRIEGLNAFIACTSLKDGHTPAFLICRACKRVLEAESDPRGGTLAQAARATGFVIEKAVREAVGLCPTCAAESAPA